LASTSADMHLLPGEYVVHEGDAHRVLFALLDGRVEVTKFIDGEELVIGVRERGQLFGEVPVILDSPFLVSFRAVERSRIARIEAQDFHAVAASAPGFAETVRAMALDRLGGLEEVAARSHHAVAVIGPRWHEETHELRGFLHRNSVEFDWFAPDDSAAAPIVEAAPEPEHFPIVRFRNGDVLCCPPLRDIAREMGLPVSPQRTSYDVAIIGGGPAGLAAAVYGASEGLATLLLEREAPGGQAGTSSRIENYLGFPFGISGEELGYRALQQAKRLGAEVVVTRSAEVIDPVLRTITLDGSDAIHARTIVLATGVTWRHLGLPALDRFRGRGVCYGAAPGEAKYVQGAHAFLVGGGNSAGQAAMHFSAFADCVTLIVRGESLAGSMSYYLIEQLKTKANVRIETRSEVVDASGDGHLERIAIANRANGTTSWRDASALFVLIGADAETDWLPPAIARDEGGYVLTGRNVLGDGRWTADRDPYLLETAVPGIFAVGDVRAGSVKRVASGVGEGSMVIALVHQYLASADAMRDAATASR
ncbi:MAG TPA: FAD-dependent oxidoreductase, partial [Candidatus Limnocylindrales bacterium]|nr:FAD-dependent oxidoreductase [Candidatus Limnocylindrales bacterium]